jgi:hypothetical protein
MVQQGMTIREKMTRSLRVSYYLVTILCMGLMDTLHRWRYNVHMRLATLRGRGGKDRH